MAYWFSCPLLQLSQSSCQTDWRPFSYFFSGVAVAVPSTTLHGSQEHRHNSFNFFFVVVRIVMGDGAGFDLVSDYSLVFFGEQLICSWILLLDISLWQHIQPSWTVSERFWFFKLKVFFFFCFPKPEMTCTTTRTQNRHDLINPSSSSSVSSKARLLPQLNISFWCNWAPGHSVYANMWSEWCYSFF